MVLSVLLYATVFLEKNRKVKLSALSPFAKKLLIMVNPNSGSGKAAKIWARVEHILGNCLEMNMLA